MASSRRTGENLPRCEGGCGACTARCHRAYHGQLSRKDALEQLFRAAAFRAEPETVPLNEALHRVCAAELNAAWSVPSANCAGHDGAAFSHDLAFEKAGKLAEGEFVPLGMGRPVPPEFDTLAPRELLSLSDDGGIRLKKLPAAGEGIVARGNTAMPGQTVIEANTPLSASALALLRSVGVERVPVWKKPRAAVLPIGEGVSPAGTEPGPGQFADGDSLLLQLMTEECGGTADILPALPGETEPIGRAVLAAAEQYDLILLCGGAGNGRDRYGDYVYLALSQVGQVITHGISMRPGGKATILAEVQGRPAIGFPGPMHAVLLMAEQLLPPVLARFLHQEARERVVTAVSTGRFPKRDGDAPFMPHVFVRREGDTLLASPIRMGDGADTFVLANGVALLEPGRDYAQGDTIRVILLPGGGPRRF